MSGLPEIDSERSEKYRCVHVAGIVGGIIPGGVEIVIYSEERDVERVLETQPISPNRVKIKRTVELELLLDPLQARSIHNWLGKQIEEYERIFGRIPSPEEIDSRTRRSPGA